jgi:hypothetical protein
MHELIMVIRRFLLQSHNDTILEGPDDWPAEIQAQTCNSQVTWRQLVMGACWNGRNNLADLEVISNIVSSFIQIFF